MASSPPALTFPEPWELPPEQYTWLRQARTEYMAAALTSQMLHWLVMLGVSPDTLARGARLVADEVRHSTQSYELYRVAGGVERAVAAPPTMLMHGDDPDADIVWRAVTAVGELAVEESVALPVFALRARNARHPRVREVVEGIHRDEAFHRAFAWDVLDELTEALGVVAVRAWVEPRIAWWVRVYLLAEMTDDEPVYDERQLGLGLIDRREHWAAMRACVAEVVRPRFHKRGLVDPARTADAIEAELRAAGADLRPPWERRSVAGG